MNTFDKLEAGAFVKFTTGPYMGLVWRVIELKRYWEDSDSDEKEQWLRAKLQKDTSGSEGIILEYNPAYPNEAYVVELHDSYKDKEQPIPICREINNVSYWTLDQEASDDNEHPGFNAFTSDNNYTSSSFCHPSWGQEGNEKSVIHWEYEGTTPDNESDPTKIFQVYFDEGWIEEFIGIQLNTTHIQIF